MVTMLSFPDGPTLIEQIEQEIASLPYPALERLAVLVLRSLDYRDIRIVDNGKQRGRSKYGGMSLMARSRGPVHDVLTLVQVKQIKVQRRYVDELHGALARWGAGRGIIVTTATIPDAARYCAELYPARPIRLISGRTLARLLIHKNLGVRTPPLAFDAPNNLVVDPLFFKIIRESNP